MRVQHKTIYGIIEIFRPKQPLNILLILLHLANIPYIAVSFFTSLVFVKIHDNC